jgi:hypothetical protein
MQELAPQSGSVSDSGSGDGAGSDAGNEAGMIDAATGCGEGFAVQSAVGGATCARRPVTRCNVENQGSGSLLAIVSDLVGTCGVLLVENRLDIAFERGCASQLAIENSRFQQQGVDCLIARLGEQRLACIASLATSCLHFEVSTLATQ